MGKFNFPIQVDLLTGDVKRSFEVQSSGDVDCADIDAYTNRVLTAISLLNENERFHYAFTRDKLSLSQFFVATVPVKVFERK